MRPDHIHNRIEQQYELADVIKNAYGNTTKVGLGNLTHSRLKTRINALHDDWQRFAINHEAISIAITRLDSSEQLVIKQRSYFQNHIFADTHDSHLDAVEKLETLLNNLRDTSHSSNPSSYAPQSSSNQLFQAPRLPRIDLPKYSGNLDDWIPFRDLFSSLVLANPGLSPVEKLQYLKTSLTGSATHLLKNTPLTADNFERAWDSVNDYYGNERLLVNSAIQSLFLIKKMTKESFAEMEQLYTAFTQIYHNLIGLRRPVDSWDDVLVFMMVQRLDGESVRAWEYHLGASRTPPTWSRFQKFILARLQSLQALEKSQPVKASTAPKLHQIRTHVSRAENDFAENSEKTLNCPVCSSSHWLNQCPKFRNQTQPQRFEFVSQNQLCFNCLGFHLASNCRSSRRCLKCGKKHHTLIHPTTDPNSTEITAVPKQVNYVRAPADPRESSQLDSLPPVLLATARVRVFGASGERREARVLFDQGSEVSLISERLAQQLELERVGPSLPILGIGGQRSGRTRGFVTLRIIPHFESSTEIRVNAHVLPKLTSLTPSANLIEESFPHLEGLTLADPDFAISAPVNIILGADIYGHVLDGAIRRGHENHPVAQSTHLGWILSGIHGPAANEGPPRIHHCAIDHDLHASIERFWLQEEIQPSTRRALSAEDQACEDHFSASHSRDGTGRYTVKLPFKVPIPQIGNSKFTALRMLEHSHRRFAKDPTLLNAYTAFLEEYQALGHMSQISQTNHNESESFYLPHHGVWRESSASTKLRVVFNGSCRVENGVPINEALHSGPKLQVDLLDVLLWQRQHQFLFTTDIKMMYRQINVAPEHYKYQRIFWKDSLSNIIAFELKTITYGLSCAPFLALRTILQLVADDGPRYPLAVPVLLKGRYVDDIFGGGDTIEEAQEVAQQIDQLCAAGGFPLRKWVSNNPKILQSIPEAHCLANDSVSINDHEIRTLGMSWRPLSDTFHFRLSECRPNATSKRAVLSQIAQFFDPLGLVSPLVIRAKVFMQELWAIKINWDDQLPPAQVQAWSRILSDLQRLEKIEIPRWLSIGPGSAIEIHGFCDASQSAMAAVVYLKSHRNNTSTITLVCSKTKVAPLKRMTIPRLELSSATLLTKLVFHCQTILDLTSAPCYLWTDSSIALTWINNHPSRWKEFVHNRVCHIQETLPRAVWRHIAGAENPADCATRGLSASELCDFPLWWIGPVWLSRSQDEWPESCVLISDKQRQCLEERKQPPPSVFVVRKSSIAWPLLEHISSFTKLLRLTSICLRVAQCFKGDREANLSRRPIGPDDLERALEFWIRITQQDAFASTLTLLKEKSLPRSHPLSRLLPFLDEHGLLRVGGRLDNAPIPYNARHPYLLPKDSSLSLRLIRNAHLRTLHGSTQDTLAFIRQSCWILGGRAPIRAFILKCPTCIRYRRRAAQQIIGQLPASRVTPSRPFLTTGIDYAGPFDLKTWKGRNPRFYKSWIAVFVCFSTSAVHLELVTDYSAIAFLAAYRRFISRRGVCATLVSDCGTNFVGAAKELKNLFDQSSREFSHLSSFIANEGTKWTFNPPASPHFGGKWEAAVKSTKYHLRRVVGNQRFTYEEFSTLLVQIEAILNSRPLCSLTDDPNDLNPLTPGHFLIGHAPTLIPEPTISPTDLSPRARWQMIQYMTQQFWKCFLRSYLQRHHSVYKWSTPHDSIKVGTIALVLDEKSPPCKWPLAKILEVFPGSDGHVRVAKIQCNGSEKLRPIVKLCPLNV